MKTLTLLAALCLFGSAEAASAKKSDSSFLKSFTLAPPTENFVYSPYGVEAVTAMIAEGARGETLAEIRKAFPNSASLGDLKSVSGAGFELSLANSAWIRKNYPIDGVFTKTLETRYHAEIQACEFKDRAGDARRINDWVSKNTKGMIPEIIQPSVIDETLRMILTNAIYFKAKWAAPFKKEGTKAEYFHPEKEKPYYADMMHTTTRFRVTRRKNQDLLVLPYLGGRQSMVLLLPRSGTSLADALRETRADDIATDATDGEFQEVVVTLPKFTISSNHDQLVSHLQSLGIRRLFSEEDADLSGVSAEKPLWVSDIIQNAKIILDEEGTEAAAATAVMVRGEGMALNPKKPLELKFDRPFAYFIRDEATHRILFLGRVAKAPESPIRK